MRCLDEHESKPEAIRPILEADTSGDGILLYSADHAQYHNDLALKQYLEDQLMDESNG